MAVITNSNPVVFGTSSADTITANYYGAANIYGFGGNDDYFIHAFYSYGDILYGGSGYSDIPVDIIHEDEGGGIDTVHVELHAFDDNTGYNGRYGSSWYYLEDNVENLIAEVSGVAQYGFNLNGNDLANSITAIAYSSSDRAIFWGAGGNDTLTGSLGNDSLYGGTGNDSMTGGAGNDKYVVDSTLDKVIEATNEGYDRVYSSVSFTLGLNVENLIITGYGNFNGTGNALNNQIVGINDNNVLNGMAGDDDLIGYDGNDTLKGGTGNDELDGGAGIDKMDGGAGDDKYVLVDASDIITDTGAGGNDTVTTLVQLSGDLAASIENLTLLESPYGSSNFSVRGNTLNNTLIADSGNNLLEGLAGNDVLNGYAGADILMGGDGNDLLDGGADGDLMNGGNGNDIYIVDNAGDSTVESSALAAGGIDSVFSSVGFTLGANVENLTLMGSSIINGFGNTLNNSIIGNNAQNSLTGGAGNDTLNGGLGADHLDGGDGNDVFIVDNGSDVVVESTSATLSTADLVKSSVTFNLATIGTEGAENLTLTGTGDINGFGNALNNLIIGNSGNNQLNGGIGNDTLQGGAGNDTYTVDDAVLDKVIEAANAGTDYVYSSVSITLAANLENLILLNAPTATNGTGNALNNFIIGNGYGNLLVGNAGNDTLKGGSGVGIDTLNGGAGNDTYMVYGTTDVIIDSGGIDTVSAVTFNPYTLGAGLENLTLIYASPITGIGNTGNNLITNQGMGGQLYGMAGNDTLDGSGSIDTMFGDIGNDTYIVENVGDIVIDPLGGGTDLVKSSVDFDLSNTDGVGGSNVENLTLTGSGNINAFGNTLKNIITGNDGDNSLIGGDGNDTLIGGLGNDGLSGGAGVDSMTGGAGNDDYYVDVAGDKVIEAVGGGIDSVSVYSSTMVGYTLGANVENLRLQGVNNINGTGNALDNIIKGNDAINTLHGGAGNDNLFGKGGNDILFGDAGTDSFNFDFNGSMGVDTVKDFVSGTDKIGLWNDVSGFDVTFNGAGGSLTGDQFNTGVNGVASDGTDRIIFDTTTGFLYYDADGSGVGSLSVQFAELHTGLNGTAVASLSSMDIFYAST